MCVGQDVGMFIRSCSGSGMWYRRFGTNRVESHEVMALRRASKHYFPYFSIFKPAKLEKGRNAECE